MPPKKIDFIALAEAALARADTLVPQWLPAGHRSGPEWRVGNLRGAAGNSLAVNLVTGVWADFSGDDKGGDLISLYAAIFHNGKQGDAAKELARSLGTGSVQSMVSAADKPKERAPKTLWVPVLPVPDDAPPAPLAHPVRGKPDAFWEYRDREGRRLGLIYRFRTSDGGKEVLPLVWAKHPQLRAEWRWLSFPDPRPLYGLWAMGDTKPVLIPEGEKCVDAALAHLSPWFDIVSWPGGGKAVGKAGWSPVVGRRVIVWPDCDAQREKGDAPEAERPLLPEAKQPGIRAAEAVAAACLALGCDVSIVAIPAPGEKSDGWDVADAIADGMTGAEIHEWILANLRPPAGVNVAAPAAAPVVPAEPADTAPSVPAVAGGGSPLSDDGPPAYHDDAPLPEPAGAAPRNWSARLLKGPKGAIEDHHANVTVLLEDHPDLEDLVGYNEFNARIEKRGKAPWRSVPGEWTSDDDRELVNWIAHRTGIVFRSTSTIAEGVETAAKRARFHPVREWLASLTWDGVDRNTTWLEKALGVAPSAYARLIGPLWLIEAVARIFRPGCQGDYAIILEGLQGKGKSSALKALGGPWFSNAPLDLSNKDSMQALQGVWIYEIAELDAFNKAEVTKVKAFMTQSEDRFRPPYGHRFVSHPRQVVFGGTTNADEYFKDPTGNRRFWPVYCTYVDLPWIEEWREQIFAQAVQEFQEGATWWPTREQERELIAPAQEQREISDPWVELILAWLSMPGQIAVNEFSTAEILLNAIKMPADRMDGQRSAATRVGNLMKKIGWGKRRGSAGGTRPWVYTRPEDQRMPTAPSGSSFKGGDDDPLPI